MIAQPCFLRGDEVGERPARLAAFFICLLAKEMKSFAMWPGSSVSGLYFAHPESRYFDLGKIERDQVADYSERKAMDVHEVERWLGQNLNYDPAE